MGKLKVFIGYAHEDKDYMPHLSASHKPELFKRRINILILSITMRKSKFSPQQISKILKEFDNGKSVDQISREHGVSSATFYNWRSKYAGMNSKELKRLKELEDENLKLKQMYATLALDHQMAKEIIEKKL
jgi:putative transposase